MTPLLENISEHFLPEDDILVFLKTGFLQLPFSLFFGSVDQTWAFCMLCKWSDAKLYPQPRTGFSELDSLFCKLIISPLCWRSCLLADLPQAEERVSDLDPYCLLPSPWA